MCCTRCRATLGHTRLWLPKEFWEQTKVKLDAVDEKAQDACADKRRLLQQLDRINTRIMRYDDDSIAASTELPADLQLDTGYDHLSDDEKKMLRETMFESDVLHERQVSQGHTH